MASETIEQTYSWLRATGYMKGPIVKANITLTDVATRDLDEKTAFSHGFNRGNYGSAYESQDWESWSVDLNDAADERGDSAHLGSFHEGALLGFFSSYELDEIPDDMVDDVEALRAAYPEVCS